MKKIKLVYWTYRPNFGDYLSPFIVKNLTGKEILYKEGYKSVWACLKRFVKRFITLNFKEMISISLPYEKTYLAIGSILSCGTSRSIIWGSGFINQNEKFKGGKVYAVRGRYSLEQIKRMGFDVVHETIGDPAILLPLIMHIPKKDSYEYGIIPHWKEADWFIKEYRGCKVIDLRTTNIKKIVEEITSCKRILSTSLHGIIVAHSYNIPAVWIKFGYIGTDGFKFYDYFSSVDIPEYEGFEDIDEIISSNENIEYFFNKHSNLVLPHCSLADLQKKLLDSAPFPIKEDIYSKISLQKNK